MPTYYSAQRGISILTCHQNTAHEVKTIKDYEEARRAMVHTVQLNDVRHCQKTPPSPLPHNYFELCLIVNTFCALVWILFRDKCDYYKGLLKVCDTLDQQEVHIIRTLSRPTCAAGLREQSLATDAPFSTWCWLRHNFAGVNISYGQHPSSTKLWMMSTLPKQLTALSIWHNALSHHKWAGDGRQQWRREKLWRGEQSGGEQRINQGTTTPGKEQL